MAESRRSAAGAYVNEWQFTSDAAGAAEAVIEPVVEWCREILAQTRRPWGISDFDLAIAVSWSGKSDPRSATFTSLKPADLYSGESLIASLHRLLCSTPEETRGAIAHVAVALFSWGDAAHYALPDQSGTAAG